MTNSDGDSIPVVRRAIRGETEALDVLWRFHRKWVASVVLAHGPHGAELEDLLQEVALTLVTKIHTLEEARAFRPWLRTVAVNVARMAARRARGAVEAVDLERSPDVEDRRVEREQMRREARAEVDRVLKALEELPVLYREALLLKSFAGQSQRAIAECLGVPESTVETRLARARRLLREKLANRVTASTSPDVPPEAKGVAGWTRTKS